MSNLKSHFYKKMFLAIFKYDNKYLHNHNIKCFHLPLSRCLRTNITETSRSRVSSTPSWSVSSQVCSGETLPLSGTEEGSAFSGKSLSVQGSWETSVRLWYVYVCGWGGGGGWVVNFYSKTYKFT